MRAYELSSHRLLSRFAVAMHDLPAAEQASNPMRKQFFLWNLYKVSISIQGKGSQCRMDEELGMACASKWPCKEHFNWIRFKHSRGYRSDSGTLHHPGLATVTHGQLCSFWSLAHYAWATLFLRQTLYKVRHALSNCKDETGTTHWNIRTLRNFSHNGLGVELSGRALPSMCDTPSSNSSTTKVVLIKLLVSFTNPLSTPPPTYPESHQLTLFFAVIFLFSPVSHD